MGLPPMMGEMFHRHRAGLFLVIFSGLSLLCLTLRIEPYIVGLKTALWFLVSPEMVYSGEFFNKLDSLSGRLFHLVHVEGENVILREQNAMLSKRELERQVLEEENNRLRTLLRMKQQNFPDAIVAEVVGRDLRDWFHAVTINKGSDDGIVPSAAVVAGWKDRPVLVGRVLETGPGLSKILLLTDAVSAVSVTVARIQDTGLLEGRNKPWLSLNYLSIHSMIQPEDEIVTAGLGGIFPPGIPVGKVLEVGNTPDGFFKEARVWPFSDFGSLREVLILQRKDLAGDSL